MLLLDHQRENYRNNTNIITSLGNVSTDENYNVLSNNWRNAGPGFNKDGSKAHIGVYGGMYPWQSK